MTTLVFSFDRNTILKDANGDPIGPVGEIKPYSNDSGQTSSLKINGVMLTQDQFAITLTAGIERLVIYNPNVIPNREGTIVIQGGTGGSSWWGENLGPEITLQSTQYVLDPLAMNTGSYFTWQTLHSALALDYQVRTKADDVKTGNNRLAALRKLKDELQSALNEFTISGTSLALSIANCQNADFSKLTPAINAAFKAVHDLNITDNFFKDEDNTSDPETFDASITGQQIQDAIDTANSLVESLKNTQDDELIEFQSLSDRYGRLIQLLTNFIKLLSSVHGNLIQNMRL